MSAWRLAIVPVFLKLANLPTHTGCVIFEEVELFDDSVHTRLHDSD
jgi:hypothetical protein